MRLSKLNIVQSFSKPHIGYMDMYEFHETLLSIEGTHWLN